MESMNEEKELLEHVMKLMAEHFGPFSALPRGAGNPPTASGRHNFQALCASKPFKDFFSSRRNTITLRRNGKKYVATR